MKCLVCKTEYERVQLGGEHQIYCSEQCRRKYNHHLSSLIRLDNKPQRQCMECGVIFRPVGKGTQKWCSVKCGNRARCHLRHVRNWISDAQYIPRIYIAELTNNTCYICGKQDTPDNFDLDHVEELDKGGQHSLENIRLCCKSCHCTKTMTEAAKEVV